MRSWLQRGLLGGYAFAVILLVGEAKRIQQRLEPAPAPNLPWWIDVVGWAVLAYLLVAGGGLLALYYWTIWTERRQEVPA